MRVSALVSWSKYILPSPWYAPSVDIPSSSVFCDKGVEQPPSSRPPVAPMISSDLYIVLFICLYLLAYVTKLFFALWPW